MRGLPKSYIKKYGISKRAWREYRKAHKKSKSRTTRKSKTKTKTRRKKSNPNRSVKRTGKNLQATVFKWLRIGSIFAPELVRAAQKKPIDNILANMVYEKTGLNPADGSFELGRLVKGWGPFFATCLATYGIPKLVGIIRRI